MPISEDNNRLYTEDGKGISLDEIAACLRDYRVTELGRDLRLLATSPNVNMWAKYKPFVRVSKAEPYDVSTEEEFFEANYGLDIPKKTTIAQLKFAYNGDLNGWGRKLPRGFAYTEPFRTLDFNGYWHGAPCPFTKLSLPSAAINRWETSGFNIAIPVGGSGVANDAIGMTEIKDIQDYYFTIQLRHKNPSGTGIFIRTLSAEKTVAESSGGYIEFSTYQLPKGEWELIPFFSSYKFTTANDGSDIPAAYSYVPIPKAYVGDMTISDIEYGLVYFDGYKNPYLTGAAARSFSFNFAVKNYTANAHTFNDVIVRVRFPEKKFNDTLVTGEAQPTIQPFTVQSGETLDYATASGGSGRVRWVSVSISQALYDNTTGIVVYIQLGSGQPVYQMYLKSTSTDTPEYNPDNDYPEIEPISL